MGIEFQIHSCLTRLGHILAFLIYFLSIPFAADIDFNDMGRRQQFDDFMTVTQNALLDLQDLSFVPLAQVKLSPELKFKEDLGLNSLGMVAFFCSLEAKYPFLTEQMVPGWKTLSDCFESIYAYQSL